MPRKIIYISILLIIVTLVGCTNMPISDLDNQVNSKNISSVDSIKKDDSGLRLIEEKRNVKIYSIDCNSFNSKPELWYLKSGSTLGFYSYIAAKEFNHPKYNIGSEQVKDEEMVQGFGENAHTLTKNESIQRHGRYCSFGSGTGQNINYLYCQDQIYSAQEISETGEILLLANIRITTIFSVDRDKERSETKGGYSPVDEASLVSQECTISIPK